MTKKTMSVEKLTSDLEINVSELDDELAHQAEYYLYVAEKAINAEMKYEATKVAFDKCVAQKDESIRLVAVEAGTKITENGITSTIDRDPKVIEKKIELIKARGEREALKALRESWYMRKDMLIQLAIKQRSEVEAIASSVVRAA